MNPTLGRYRSGIAGFSNWARCKPLYSMELWEGVFWDQRTDCSARGQRIPPTFCAIADSKSRGLSSRFSSGLNRNTYGWFPVNPPRAFLPFTSQATTQPKEALSVVSLLAHPLVASRQLRTIDSGSKALA